MITLLLVHARAVPEDDSWLAPEERAILATLRVPKRRADWRGGRFAAKRAVAMALGVAPASVRVRRSGDGAPEADVDGAPARCTLSISHAAGRALAMVVTPAEPVGCDVERVESRPHSFIGDWFRPREQDFVDAAAPSRRDVVVTAIWSAKESALKALRCGLRRDTRSVEVGLVDRGVDGWQSLTVRDVEGGAVLPGWWQVRDDVVVTAVVSSPAGPPVLAVDKRRAAA